MPKDGWSSYRLRGVTNKNPADISMWFEYNEIYKCSKSHEDSYNKLSSPSEYIQDVQDIQYSGMPYIWDANLLLLILKKGSFTLFNNHQYNK